MKPSAILPAAACALLPAVLAAPLSAQLPDGYVDELVLDGLNGPVGFVHDASGRMFVWERRGRVYVVEDGAVQQPPLVNIAEEVGNWRDFGMLGVVLDPDFLVNGHLYLYYVVDRHHLLYHGTPEYDPQENRYFAATIGRVTRYTANPATGFRTLVPDSRFVLVGESIDTGVPILHQSHGTGSLVFGTDRTLLVSSGDGASYDAVDAGSLGGTYWQAALADGIIRPEENVGAFRSQMIGSLSGKILRIDPTTGDGLPTNPFYDPAEPRAPRSRVWALGLRNPFRFTLLPGSGDADPAAGNPGILFVGDVGWSTWEELHVVTEAGMNLGWPIYEGLTRMSAYKDRLTENRDAPNPLFGGACDREFFWFQELLMQEQEDHDPSFPNPCDGSVEIATSTPTFMHRRAALDWRHGQNLARVPIFVDGKAKRSQLGDVDCPVAGDPFQGFCSVGGTWMSDLAFGEPYKGLYFHADHVSSWIRGLRFDVHDHGGEHEAHLEEVLVLGAVPAPTFLGEDPNDHSLLYVSLTGESVRRIRFTGDANVAPVARIEAQGSHGASPLTLRLDGTASADPEGGPLTFHWDFGDATTSDEPSPLHTFTNPGGTPSVRTVTLTVTDEAGASTLATLPVWLDNTPPVVAITSFANGASYSTDADTLLDLAASVSDAEHSGPELSHEWQVFLHHNTHFHPEAPIAGETAQVLLTPTPCSGELYAYRVRLTVTDAAGLATSVEHWLLPDCPGPSSVTLVAPDGNAVIDPGDGVLVQADAIGAVARVDLYEGSELVGSSFAPPYVIPWTPDAPGPVVLSALATVDGGDSVVSPGLVLDVRTPLRAAAAVARVRDDGEENLFDGTVARNRPTLNLAMQGATPQRTGMRFALDVPQGAKIVSATLQLTSVSEDATGLARLVLSAEATDHAPPIRADLRNLSARATTAATVTWFPEAWTYPLARGARQRAPDLRAVLQEIVDRPGFASGNAVLILVDGFGERRARAFRVGEVEEPTLVVEYAQ